MHSYHNDPTSLICELSGTPRQISKDFSRSADHYTLSFTLEDKYGDNGLIAVVILQRENTDILFIDTWLMSCRVLKRGMENFVLNTIVELAKENGYVHLRGEYIATAKNENGKRSLS